MENRIHKFHLNGVYCIIDINSGSVHVVEKIIYDIIDDYDKLSDEEIASKYNYELSDVAEALAEINSLKSEGLLFSEPIDVDTIPFANQNIVKALCLHMAHDCNLKCEYCFASQGNFNGEKCLMPLSVGKRALEF